MALPPVRAACIDIGSNTTRLLVAESHGARLTEIAAQRHFVRLTLAERREGLPPEKAAAIVEAVRAQAAEARAAGVPDGALRVVATAALRDLPDRHALLERIRAAAGVEPEVLTGADEARFAFRGATAALPPDGQRVVVADVGGGSTELAAGTTDAGGGAVTWWASLPIGSGALADEHLHGDPPTRAELDAARAAARDALGRAGCPGAGTALAVGGSATSLRRLCGPVLSAAAIDAALERVCVGPAAERAPALDLHEERLRLLPAGLVLLSEVARATSCPLHVAAGGLREGVVLDLLARAG